jgi:hypothetical protein
MRRFAIVGGIIAVLGIVAVSAALGLTAGGGADKADEMSSTARAAGTESSGDVPSEGIKVHGAWAIDVRNPDGSLVDRYKFENALTAAGGSKLTEFLAGDSSVGRWAILVDSAILDGPCEGSFTPAGCGIAEPDTAGASTDSTNLSVTLDAGALVLAGSVEAERDGSIDLVKTLVGACGPSTPPDSCTQGINTSLSFTQKGLNPAISVKDGQEVEVTVEISFS